MERWRKLRLLYRQFCRENSPDDRPGLCKAATRNEVRNNQYALTPARYVGSERTDDEDEPFEEKMPRLIALLNKQFEESARLEKAIRSHFDELDYGR